MGSLFLPECCFRSHKPIICETPLGPFLLIFIQRVWQSFESLPVNFRFAKKYIFRWTVSFDEQGLGLPPRAAK